MSAVMACHRRLSPLFFVGCALLYVDQKARLRVGLTTTKEGAMPVYIMLSSLTAQGVQTAEVEPGPAARR